MLVASQTSRWVESLVSGYVCVCVCVRLRRADADVVQRHADATKKAMQEVVAKNLLLPATLLGVADRIGGSNGPHSFGGAATSFALEPAPPLACAHYSLAHDISILAVQPCRAPSPDDLATRSTAMQPRV